MPLNILALAVEGEQHLQNHKHDNRQRQCGAEQQIGSVGWMGWQISPRAAILRSYARSGNAKATDFKFASVRWPAA
ncbi:MAG: hypothetical protein NVV62_11350 [Terricaulis sp.]|nr:hypothetical protein [Terricaulis sp.]